ncbi:MAG: Bug family tripartite tricarboxylate transporter substrate binding protein [Betaproteobacteria bacterium]
MRLAAFLSLLCASAVAAAQSYPAKPVRLVNPFAPGGTGEIIFRMIAPAIEERMGQRIVIESRAGAGGNIGAEIVANAPADGYTLLLGTTNIFTINQFIFSKMSFDPLKVFAPVTLVADVPSVFYVSNAVPASTLREFVAWARANPGKVNYASPGNGTTPHLNVELLAQIADLKLVHVPYKGLQPSMAAVVANEVQLYLGGLGAGQGLLRAGKMKAIAVGSRERLPAAPELPTLAESGYRDFVASNWFALAAPAGTDAAVRERWAAEVQRAVQSPDTSKKLSDLGIVPVGSTPAELARVFADESKLWERVIRTSKIKAD